MKHPDAVLLCEGHHSCNRAQNERLSGSFYFQSVAGFQMQCRAHLFWDDNPTSTIESAVNSHDLQDTLYVRMSKELSTRVWKWGNSLAFRLPAEVVDALQLKEGDQIELRIAGPREFEMSRARSREAAIERLRKPRRPLPVDFTFHRSAANER